MSLYGDAISAMRRVVLIDERVVRATDNLRELSGDVRDLRERVSRLEGMIAGLTAGASDRQPIPNRRKLPKTS